ncbi:MAG: HU family DNA-binding protein, partial [Rhodothermales bacterium]
ISMDETLEERFAEALVETVRSELSANGEVTVPGFGQFLIEHQSSHFRETDEGEIVLHPPAGIVRFRRHER